MLRRLFQPTLARRRIQRGIVMYHRVAETQCDPWQLAVNPHRFEEQIAYVARYRTPLSMEEFVQRLRSHTLPPDAIAITFDDGYRDNLRNAAPVLCRYKVPATVFLATGYIGKSDRFWWDELATLTLACRAAANSTVLFNGEAAALSWAEWTHHDEKPWHASRPPRTARQTAYLQLWKRLRSCSMEERRQFLHRLRLELRSCAQSSDGSELDLPMRAPEVQALLATELISIGAHSVTHPLLPELSSAQRLEEITASRDTCSTLAAHPVCGFAYPHGAMDRATRDDVERSGFDWACSTKSRTVDTEQFDPFDLPRVQALDAGVAAWLAPG